MGRTASIEEFIHLAVDPETGKYIPTVFVVTEPTYNDRKIWSIHGSLEKAILANMEAVGINRGNRHNGNVMWVVHYNGRGDVVAKPERPDEGETRVVGPGVPEGWKIEWRTMEP
jgi:hypothetical protein